MDADKVASEARELLKQIEENERAQRAGLKAPHPWPRYREERFARGILDQQETIDGLRDRIANPEAWAPIHDRGNA